MKYEKMLKVDLINLLRERDDDIEYLSEATNEARQKIREELSGLKSTYHTLKSSCDERTRTMIDATERAKNVELQALTRENAALKCSLENLTDILENNKRVIESIK